MVELNWELGFAKSLEAVGVELDQRMHDAIKIVPGRTLIAITGALQSLNARGFHFLPNYVGMSDSESVLPSPYLSNAVNLVASRLPPGSTFSSSHFLKAILAHGESDPPYHERSTLFDNLARKYTGNGGSSLAGIPQVQELFLRLNRLLDDDYQYVLAFEQGRIRFRIVSELGDYVQHGDTGLLVPYKALLTHLGRIGFFIEESIAELEYLINDSAAKEKEFQEFFERYPGFLRRLDYREVHPHVYLRREGEGELIPDFILTNTEAQRAAIVELKLASALRSRIVRHQDNRVRFADCVMEARSQLLTYRDWFEIPKHRQSIANQVGMEIYRPAMMVIIGRASDFAPGIERALLESRTPDVQIYTYDDLLREAKQRRAIVDLK